MSTEETVVYEVVPQEPVKAPKKSTRKPKVQAAPSNESTQVEDNAFEGCVPDFMRRNFC